MTDKKENKANDMDVSQEDIDNPYVVVVCRGCTKKIIECGKGTRAPPGSQVKIHYTGTIKGVKFDSSRDRNEPFSFELGKGSVIKGWDKAIPTMKIGERCILTCRPSAAYGKEGKPPSIPKNATLVFDLQLLSYKEKGVDITPEGGEAGGIIKKIVTRGEGYDHPCDTAKCLVYYKATASNHAQITPQDPDIAVEVDLGKDLKVTRGLSMALQSMVVGEEAAFRIKPSYCYGENGNKKLKVPPNSDIIYDIELIRFDNGVNPWEMDTKQKIEWMMKRKDKGNKLYSKKYFLKAEDSYNLSITTFKEEEEKDLNDEQKKEIQTIRVDCYSNLALCQMKQKEYYESIRSCDKALAMNKDHVKALFRRAQARTLLGEDKAALKDLRAAKKLKPDDKAILDLFDSVRKQLKDTKKKEKDTYGGFLTSGDNSNKNVIKVEGLTDDRPDFIPIPQKKKPKERKGGVDYSKWDKLEESSDTGDESKEENEQEDIMKKIMKVASDIGVQGSFYNPRTTNPYK